MRFDALYLDAVGPFTGRRLDLSAGEQGVHVIYGPNEAGKSSSLRALHALLFGFPAQTDDNFIHEYKDLRVGAVLRERSGATLTCTRRKGTRNTLLDATGNALDGDPLARLLAGVDETVFSRLFGIDHAALVAGGEALVAEHGREAEALFGSGLGSNVVHEVRKALEEEAAMLFAPRASKPTLNALFAELERVRRAERDASLAASRWDEVRRAADRAAKALQAIETDLATARTRRTALERLRRTLPDLARRAQLIAARDELGEAPDLAPDFAERRAQAMDMRRAALERSRHTDVHLENLREAMQSLSPEQSLLDEQELIDALVQRLGAQRKAERDRPARVAEREAVATELATLNAYGGIEGADTVTLLRRLNRKRRAEELAAQREAREQAVRDTARRLADGQAELERLRRKHAALPAPSNPGALRDAVHAARQAGNLDAQIHKLAAAADLQARECVDELRALGRWQGSADELLAAPLPDDAALADFAQRFDSQVEQQRRADDARDALVARREQAREQLRALAVGGEVPSEADLAQARAHRDTGWALLRARWLDGRDVSEQAGAYCGTGALPEAYEGAVQSADDVADRLRRDAERLHARDAQVVERDEASRALQALDARVHELAVARASLQAQWHALWQPGSVDPASVREMAGWLQRAQRLRERLRQARAAVADLAAVQAQRVDHRARLAEALGDPDAGSAPADATSRALGPVLARAEQALERMLDNERERVSLDEGIASLTDSLRALEDQHRECERMLAEWYEAWAALAAELGVPASLTSGEVSEHFMRMQQLGELTRKDGDLAARLHGMGEDTRHFAADTQALCARVAPDLAARDAEAAVSELRARLLRQLKLKERLDALREQADAVRREHDKAVADRHVAESAIGDLCREGGGVAPEALEELEQRAARHKRLRAELEEVERSLARQGDGETPDALAQAAHAVNPDEVAAELQALVHRVDEELEPRRRDLAEQKVNAARDFDDMQGGDTAAERAERAQQLLAAIHESARRYMRVRLAARVLRDQIEQFRARNRDPILAAAGGYLATLTGGAFTAVDTDFDDKDQPVLSAVRQGGARLGVEALSTGTRDQLYLALRLAALDNYLRGDAEPLPFMVDDILVQFDDGRTRATLRALAEFSRQTQVLLFTHHERVAQDARVLGGLGGGVFVHELAGA